MKKGKLEKFMHLATKKSWFFYGFMVAGIALFLWLTLTTQIETAEGTQTLLYIIFVRAGRGL